MIDENPSSLYKMIEHESNYLIWTYYWKDMRHQKFKQMKTCIKYQAIDFVEKL